VSSIPSNLESESSKEPSVLSAGISFLKQLLDRLLGIFTLTSRFLESVVLDDSLELFELECISGWHQVVVVDDLRWKSIRKHVSYIIIVAQSRLLHTLIKGLTLLRLANFLAPIDLVTFRGYRSIPATKTWGKGLSLFPSSYC
jgi:hypothetical protein